MCIFCESLSFITIYHTVPTICCYERLHAYLFRILGFINSSRKASLKDSTQDVHGGKDINSMAPHYSSMNLSRSTHFHSTNGLPSRHSFPILTKHTHTYTHTLFFAEKVLWVRQRTIKLGEKTRVPVWQSTQLQTTGYELCNKNSIKTNVWKTKEEIDTGTLAMPNSQDMISDYVLIMKCHPSRKNNMSKI